MRRTGDPLPFLMQRVDGMSQGDGGYPLHGLVQWVVRTKLEAFFSILEGVRNG
jgi:hypothetical protein